MISVWWIMLLKGMENFVHVRAQSGAEGSNPAACSEKVSTVLLCFKSKSSQKVWVGEERYFTSFCLVSNAYHYYYFSVLIKCSSGNQRSAGSNM